MKCTEDFQSEKRKSKSLLACMAYISDKENSLLRVESHCHFFSAFTANWDNLNSVLSDRFEKPFSGNQSFLSCRSSHAVAWPVLIVETWTWAAVSARAGIVNTGEQWQSVWDRNTWGSGEISTLRFPLYQTILFGFLLITSFTYLELENQLWV